MSTQSVTLLTPDRHVVATAQVAEQHGQFVGQIDCSAMPPPLQRLFQEYEEIVNTQVLSLLDAVEDQIAALHLIGIFEDGQESALTDVQIYPGTKTVSFQIAQGVSSLSHPGQPSPAASSAETFHTPVPIDLPGQHGEMPYQLRQTLAWRQSHMLSVAWSPDGQRLAAGSTDNCIYVWNISTAFLECLLEGHQSAVVSVAWAPDGRTLVSAAGDNTVRLWDATEGRALHTLREHQGEARGVAWAPAGRTLASGAGAFGALAPHRPESTPRLYNLIEIARDHSWIKVHTRAMRKAGGAWEGWAVWPGATAHEKRTYYEIRL